MSVLIFSPEKSVRDSLFLFCNRLGYTNINAFGQVDEAVEFLQETPKIQLIFSTWTPSAKDIIYVLTAYQEQNSQLNTVPLIQILPYRPILQLFKRGVSLRSTSTRVDQYLIRPFTALEFRNSIRRAHKERALHRDTILFIGKNLRDELLHLLWSQAKEPGFHWRKILFAQDEKELEKCLGTQSEKIGLILIEPESLNPKMSETILRFKKNGGGWLTPVVTLGHEPLLVNVARNFTDLFVAERKTAHGQPYDLHFVLKLASDRMAKQWIVQKLITRSVDHLKEEHQKGTKPKTLRSFLRREELALALLNEALEEDPSRWETHEALGRYFMKRNLHEPAITHFLETLKTNPTSPRAHLSLIELYAHSPEKKKAALENALRYCPRLPELQKHIEKRSAAA